MTEWDSWSQQPTRSQYDDGLFENNIVKYFVHGLVFAICLPLFYMSFEFVFLFGFMGTDVSSIFGILGLVAIFLPLLFGFLNGELSRRLWGLNPNKSVTTWYGQGLLIFFMLPLFGGLYFILILIFTFGAMLGSIESIVILIVLIGLDSIASGYIGRHVAVEFEGAREGAEELASVRDRHVICPHCRQRFVRQTSKVDFDGMVSCPHCGGKLAGQPDGPGPTDSFDSFNQ